MNGKPICIDFDGTCVTHDYPDIGHDIGAFPVLKRLQAKGHKLILFTMRSGKELEYAVQCLALEGIELYGVNRNPSQDSWTKSPKAYGALYIDDAALGTPLIFDRAMSDRPFVDWKEVEKLLEQRGWL